MAITPGLGVMTVDEYHRLGETGVLDEDARVELVEGRVVEMPPIGPRHMYNVNRLNELFMFRLFGRMVLSIQNPVTFGQRLERQPDVTLLDPHADQPRYYESHRPTPSDVLLIVEVSDSTLETDLREKAQQYGRHGIAEYWVVDLQGDRLVVHRQPTTDGYAKVESLERAASVSPLAFPDVTFSADEILG